MNDVFGNLPCTALRAHIGGAGEKLILVHGGRGSHTHWIKNIGPLSEWARVYALDLPGFGDAPEVPSGIDADKYLALVEKDVRALIGADHASIIGFSFGGAVAADLARRLGAQCRKLALIGPGGFGEATGRQLDLRPPPTTVRSDPRYRAVIRHNLLAMMLYDEASLTEDTIDVQCANIEHARFNSLKISLRQTLLDDIAAVKCPLLMIWGERDVVAHPSPTGRAAQCKAVRPDVEIVMVPNAGHWVQYEKADTVNTLLQDFVRN